ncbi:MAG TPA: hypothetical protein VIQ25_19135 [Gemmatimonadales bacterium]|jgi:hypothetical protein
MQSRELPCGRVLLAAAALLSLAAPTARAQIREGVPTSITMALAGGLAALNAVAHPPMSYAGRDAEGVPHYATRPFSPEEREVLRRRYGIEDPSRLYLSDSTSTGHLNYDTERDPGAGRLVRSYRVGAASIRRDGETWEALERRLRTLRPTDFGPEARVVDTTLASLDSLARPRFERLIAAAHAAGFRLRVTEAYRPPKRQAYLMVKGGGLTFTATSMHSAGHAVDLAVGDGDLRNPRTRASWIAFRRWVAGFEGGRFRLLGTPERSWDWPHIELADAPLGFRSVEAMLEAARR